MRFLTAWAFSAIALPLAGCGSSGSGGPDDAGADTSSAVDAEDDYCPFCGAVEDVGVPHGDDGSSMVDGALTSCAQMEEALQGLQVAAQACNSNLTMQCNGETMGPCCPITVTASNTSAVNDYDVAVASYMMACTPNCTMAGPCAGPTPPSNRCVTSTMGTGDVCE